MTELLRKGSVLNIWIQRLVVVCLSLPLSLFMTQWHLLNNWGTTQWGVGPYSSMFPLTCKYVYKRTHRTIRQISLFEISIKIKYAEAKKLGCVWCFCLPSLSKQEMVFWLILISLIYFDLFLFFLNWRFCAITTICALSNSDENYCLVLRQCQAGLCGDGAGKVKRPKGKHQVGGAWCQVTRGAWNGSSEKRQCRE